MSQNQNQQRTPDPNRSATHPDYPHLKIKERLFKSVDELREKIDKYFAELKDNKKQVMSASGQVKNIDDPLIPTIESLASYLGFKSVKSLYNYAENPDYADFHDVVAEAKAKILGLKTLGLVNGKGSSAGLIFDLVNNHGYKNKSEVESEGKLETTIKVVYE
jgi:hypothetical protein